nr:hypothetical protein [Tanacetum cinerariifolium]
MGEGSAQPIDTQHTPTFDMPLPKPKKTQKPRQPRRKTTKVPQPSEFTNIATDEAVYKERGDSLVRATTTAFSLEAEQDSGNIGIEDVGDEEVVEVVTTAKMLINIVVDVVQVTTDIADNLVRAAETIVTIAPTITAESKKTNVEVTQAPKRKGVMIQELEETTTMKTVSLQQPQVQDKGKGKAKLIKEPKMPKKRKHQIRADKELDEKLQAEMQAEIDEEDRLARERERAQKKQEENDALMNTWDDIQAMIDVDDQLAQRLQEEEKLQLIDAKKAKLFMKFIKKRRKFFVAKRDEEKRNKPPTKAQ